MGKRAEWTYVVDTTKVAYFTVVSGSKVDIYIKDGVSTNGVVDYYKLQNLTADTNMRNSISGKKDEKPKHGGDKPSER